MKLLGDWRDRGDGQWDLYVNGGMTTVAYCPIGVAKGDDGLFWILTYNTMAETIAECECVGPFPDLESALIAADTMHALKEYPI